MYLNMDKFKYSIYINLNINSYTYTYICTYACLYFRFFQETLKIRVGEIHPCKQFTRSGFRRAASSCFLFVLAHLPSFRGRQLKLISADSIKAWTADRFL